MLTLADREEISGGLAKSVEYREIAVLIGRSPSVVSHAVAGHGGRDGYRATDADRAARAGRTRPKPMAVERGPGLRAEVVGVAAVGVVIGVDRGPVAGRAPGPAGLAGVLVVGGAPYVNTHSHVATCRRVVTEFQTPRDGPHVPGCALGESQSLA
jgi:transposase, IS30 family